MVAAAIDLARQRGLKTSDPLPCQGRGVGVHRSSGSLYTSLQGCSAFAPGAHSRRGVDAPAPARGSGLHHSRRHAGWHVLDQLFHAAILCPSLLLERRCRQMRLLGGSPSVVWAGRWSLALLRSMSRYTEAVCIRDPHSLLRANKLGVVGGLKRVADLTFLAQPDLPNDDNQRALGRAQADGHVILALVPYFPTLTSPDECQAVLRVRKRLSWTWTEPGGSAPCSLPPGCSSGGTAMVIHEMDRGDRGRSSPRCRGVCSSRRRRSTDSRGKAVRSYGRRTFAFQEASMP